jgi:hypothetical protein
VSQSPRADAKKAVLSVLPAAASVSVSVSGSAAAAAAAAAATAVKCASAWSSCPAWR